MEQATKLAVALPWARLNRYFERGDIMAKFYLAAAAAIMTSLGVASAQEAANNPLIVWHGAATLTSLTPGCASANYVVGDSAFSVFRPRLDPAEPNSAITLTFGRAGHAYFRSGGTSSVQMNGNSTYTSPWYSGRATSSQGGNSGNITLALSPATVTAATNVVTIVGTITRFHGINNCTVQFRGSYYKRPN
jgi:hypothetical protein